MTTTKNRTPKATVRPKPFDISQDWQEVAKRRYLAGARSTPKLTDSDLATIRMALIQAVHYYDDHGCPIFAEEARELLHRLQENTKRIQYPCETCDKKGRHCLVDPCPTLAGYLRRRKQQEGA